METSIEKISYEVYKSNNLTNQITGKSSVELVERMKDIQNFKKTFGSFLIGRPFIFQKFSFHGLILAREILSRAREEVNQHCMEDLAKEISNKQQEITELKKISEKNSVQIKYDLKEGSKEEGNDEVNPEQETTE